MTCSMGAALPRSRASPRSLEVALLDGGRRLQGSSIGQRLAEFAELVNLGELPAARRRPPHRSHDLRCGHVQTNERSSVCRAVARGPRFRICVC